MTTRDRTCQDRISEHLAGRLSDFRQHNEGRAIDPPADAMDEKFEYPLSVDVIRTLRVDLSTGGPADWFEAQLGSDNRITRIEYHFADWFDHAATVLEGPDFDAAEAWLEGFVEVAIT